MKRSALAFLTVAVLAIGLYVAAIFGWSYSSGERAGWVQKFSRKGWVCKTWEGELAMVTLPGVAPEKFPFTVRDDAVAAQLNRAVGQRVMLHYEQHRGIPGDCFGETQYWVDAVTVEAPLLVPAVPAPSASPAAPAPPVTGNPPTPLR